MNNKIEVGCLVMLKDAETGYEQGVGASGIVVAKHFNRGNGIHIQQNGKVLASFYCDFIWQAETPDGDIYAETKSLLRIDDHQEETETQEQEMTA